MSIRTLFSISNIPFAQTGEMVRDLYLAAAPDEMKLKAWKLGNDTIIRHENLNLGLDITKFVNSGDASIRVGKNIIKGTFDYGRGDYHCSFLCGVSTACEVLSATIAWVPLVPYKGQIYCALKGGSICCITVRDWCFKTFGATSC